MKKTLVTGFSHLLLAKLFEKGILSLCVVYLYFVVDASSVGYFAVFLSIFTISLVLVDVGVSTALIKMPKDELGYELNALYLVNSLVFILLCSGMILLVFSNFTFAEHLNQYKLFACYAISLVSAANFSVYKGVAMRDLRTKIVAKSEFYASVLAGCGILFALLILKDVIVIFYGITLSWLTKIIYVRSCILIPKGQSFDKMKAQNLLVFGGWVGLGKVLGQAGGKIDAPLLAIYLPLDLVGVYFVAQKATVQIMNLLTSNLDQIMFPALVKKNNAREKLYFSVLNISSFILSAACPIIFFSSSTIAQFARGEHQVEFELLLKLFAFSILIRSLGGGLVSSFAYASGAPKLGTIVNTLRFILLPICLYVGVQFSVIGAAIGFLVYSITSRIFSQYLLYFFFDLSILKFLKCIILSLITIVVCFTVSNIMNWYLQVAHINMKPFSSDLLSTSIVIIVYISIYFGYLQKLRR